MTDETAIESYKALYSRLLPLPAYRPLKGTKSHLATLIKQLIADVRPLVNRMEKDKSIKDIGVNLKRLFTRLEQFAREHFVSETLISQLTFQEHLLGPSQLADPAAEALRTAITDTFSFLTFGYKPLDKINIARIYNNLLEFDKCLSDGGLHVDISQRSSSFYRYNILIEYQEGRTTTVDYRVGIPLDQLLRNFIDPYHSGKTMDINGKKITEKQRRRITITVTNLKDDEIELYKAKHRLWSDPDFIKKCKDETNVLLDNSTPPEQPSNSLQYQLKDDFIDLFVEGIRKLQGKDDQYPFIRALKEGEQRDEGAFRDWFDTYFGGSGFSTSAVEVAHGRKRIDLVIYGKGGRARVIEFKGWWNRDSKNVIDQIIQYLTDFEGDGYIFLVNHLKRDIVQSYSSMVKNEESGYQPGSWSTKRYLDTDFRYYVSKHKKHNRMKTIYHFIYRIHP